MRSLADEVDSLARREGFSGVVRIDRGDHVELTRAYGLAHRGHGIANTPDTQFAIASGTKGLTALAVVTQSMRYGLGFWLREAGDGVMLEGSDAGVSFRSVHDPPTRVTSTVMSNTSGGAWPIARLLHEMSIA